MVRRSGWSAHSNLIRRLSPQAQSCCSRREAGERVIAVAHRLPVSPRSTLWPCRSTATMEPGITLRPLRVGCGGNLKKIIWDHSGPTNGLSTANHFSLRTFILKLQHLIREPGWYRTNDLLIKSQLLRALH